MKKFRTVLFFIMFLLVIFSLILMFQHTIIFRKSLVYFIDKYNNQFCLDQTTCITLPKGYIPMISGKTSAGEIYTDSMFIDKNSAIRKDVIPESIRIILFPPNDNSGSIIEIYKILDIKKELSPFVNIDNLDSNKNIITISTKKVKTIYSLNQKLKIRTGDINNSKYLLDGILKIRED